MNSAALQEVREYDVYVPSGHDHAPQRFPVIYVLDAGGLFFTTVAAVQSLSEAGAMPPAIVIGVRNTNRERDFTPVPSHPAAMPQGVGTTGGVGPFTRFLRDELIPRIDRRYRTAPSRALIGHSLGGLAAMYVLATTPATFRSFITLEPSLWWDRRAVADSVLHALGTAGTQATRLVAVERGSQDGWRPDSTRLVAAFRATRRLSFVSVPGVTHQQLPYRGIYEGLRALFSGYPSPATYDPALASVAALQGHYATLSREFGYPIEVPAAALLDAAQRRLDAHGAHDAIALLAYGATLFPNDPRIRARLADARREAAVPTARRYVAFVPATTLVAAQLVGTWEQSVAALGNAPAQRVQHAFTFHGDSLMHSATVYVSADSADRFAIAPMPVSVLGDTISWERLNRAGGSYVTRLVRRTDGVLIGDERGIDLPTPPPGVVNQPVPVRLERRRQ